MANHVLEFFESKIGKTTQDLPSPLGKWLNGTFLEAKEGEMLLSFEIRKEMTNPLGILHGGTAAAIIDEVMGIAVYSLSKENVYVTVSLTVDFLDNAKEGETIFAKAKVIRNGKTVVNVECQLVNAHNKILAKGTSNMVTTKIKTI